MNNIRQPQYGDITDGYHTIRKVGLRVVYLSGGKTHPKDKLKLVRIVPEGILHEYAVWERT